MINQKRSGEKEGFFWFGGEKTSTQSMEALDRAEEIVHSKQEKTFSAKSHTSK